jgi:RimJ/RimL family protein N-acetyltransferase
MQDPEIARYFPPSVPVVYSSPEHMRTFFEARMKNNVHTFVVFCDDKIVGSYSYIDIQPQHRYHTC